MMFALQFRSALLLAASAVAGPAMAQALPPGAITYPAGGDPFAGGAYATPIGAPVAVAFGDGMSSPGTIISGPTISGAPPAGGPVYMAPQVIGGTVPGSPGCNCGPGGAPLMGDPSGGMILSDPSMGMPFGASPGFVDPSCAVPGYGAPAFGAPAYGGYASQGTGCCVTDAICSVGRCLFDPCGHGAAACNPCPPVCDPCPPVCDPCQPGGFASGGYGSDGGVFHGAGGGQRCGWATGYSFVFLKPFYGGSDAFFVTSGSGATTNRDFDHSLDLSSRVFVEYVGRSDMGVRATWFGFDGGSDPVNGVAPAGGAITRPLGTIAIPGETVRASSSFDLDTIDFDLTQRMRIRKALLNVGGGVRWGEFDHDYESTLTSDVIGTEIANASRRFSGVGPTVFAELRRPIGSSRFSLLANVRGSMLYGESKSVRVVEGPFGPNTYSNSENDDFVAIGESQLGGEWSAWLSQRTVLFVQMAWETQYWLGVGTAFDKNDDLGLFGFSTTVGLEW